MARRRVRTKRNETESQYLGLGVREVAWFAAILLAGVGFLAPTLWAWTATESFNQAAAFTLYNDALASLRGAAPVLMVGMGLGVLAGSCAISVVALIALRGVENLSEASPVRLRWAIALSLLISVPILLATSLGPWAFSLVLGGTAVAMLALVPLGALSARGFEKDRGLVPWWIWRFMAVVGLSLLGLLWIAQGLRPVPSAEVQLPDGSTEVVLLVRASEEETVFLRPAPGESSFATGTLNFEVVPGKATELRYCKTTPVASPFRCD